MFVHPTSSSSYPSTPLGTRPGDLPLLPSFIEELYGAQRKPRNFRQWEEAAWQNSQELKQYGSPAPLVWVLVKGHSIPANAIIAGEEKRQPLYIARTFYEGGLCVGKAGRQLEKGASISFNGREVHIDTYEVLVPALQPTRYQLSDTVRMPAIPRTIRKNEPYVQPVPAPRPQQHLERLNSIKTVILIDDSASMAGTLWRDAREALAGIVDLNAKVSTDGVDLFFMNDSRFGLNLKDAHELRSLFDSVLPVGETPTGRKLQELFNRYLPLIEDRSSQHRPITLVVLTDGVPTDDPEEVIIEAARRLDRNQVPLKKFGIQFTQIGDDPDATAFLKELDDDLYVRYNCRDIVDTTPFNPNDRLFTPEKLIKILLGAIDHNLDAHTSPLVSPTPHAYASNSYDQLRTPVSLQMPRIPDIPQPHHQHHASSSFIRQPSLTRPSSVSPGLERLNLIKTAFLVDDSASMGGGLWRDAREALAGVIELNGRVSTEGIDVFFINDPRFLTDIRNATELRNLFDSVTPSGTTPTGWKLRTLFDRYLPPCEDRRPHRPTELVVISDGVPTDNLEDALIEAASRLDRARAPLKDFHLDFVQIGDNPQQETFLRKLDSGELSIRHGCRNIVDATPFNPNERILTTEKLVRTLLGAIDRGVGQFTSPLLSQQSSLPSLSLNSALSPLG